MVLIGGIATKRAAKEEIRQGRCSSSRPAHCRWEGGSPHID